jgi:hypothetical protein
MNMQFTKTSPVLTDLPKMVWARDYHDFTFMEDAYRQLGLAVVVEEVAFYDMSYHAVVHLNTPEHRLAVDEARKYFEAMDEEE